LWSDARSVLPISIFADTRIKTVQNTVPEISLSEWRFRKFLIFYFLKFRKLKTDPGSGQQFQPL
jgi:hypothetical protein